MKEIWKDIPGYEGRYQASSLGRIRSVDHYVNGMCHSNRKPFKRIVKGKVLSPGRHSDGHLSVVLGHGTPGKLVHQLVMRTFVGEPGEGDEVLHNNGNPTDNRLENLRYGSRRENILDVFRQGKVWRKLSTEDVYDIRFEILCGVKGRTIAKRYGVCESTISAIKRGETFEWLR